MGWDGKIPFIVSIHGGPPRPAHWEGEYAKEDHGRHTVPPFQSRAVLVGHERGRSSAVVYFRFVDESGDPCPDRPWTAAVSLKTFMEYIRAHGLPKDQTVDTTWSFVKRGRNYLLEMGSD